MREFELIIQLKLSAFPLLRQQENNTIAPLKLAFFHMDNMKLSQL